MSLRKVTQGDLLRLRDSLQDDRIKTPLTALGLSACGFRIHQDALEVLQGLERGPALAICQAVLEERERPVPEVDLVWTGPSALQNSGRYTSIAVADLFSKATKEVFIAGYSFDHGEIIFEPLHQAMKDQNIRTRLVVDVRRGRRRNDKIEHAMIYIDQFLQKNWPFGKPHPEIYYDPRTAESDSLTSMHAKCVVIDQKDSLVGSANFTDRGHSRNIEVGALVKDAGFATRLLAQWNSLISSGALKRYGD